MGHAPPRGVCDTRPGSRDTAALAIDSSCLSCGTASAAHPRMRILPMLALIVSSCSWLACDAAPEEPIAAESGGLDFSSWRNWDAHMNYPVRLISASEGVCFLTT